jgi:outer membrane protein assembly factor BamB
VNQSSQTVLYSCLLFVFSWALSSADADDWPHWRGPDRNDISAEEGLLQQWPAEGPRQIWINQQAGLGYAGISIVSDQLFTLGLEGKEEFALCLNAETGEELWRKSIGPRYKNKWGDGPRSTPSVHGDRVYVMTAAGNLACLNKENGDIIWTVAMKEFGGKVPVWGYAESPLVDDGQVVCTPGGPQGTMLALDKETGDKIWQSEPLTKLLEDGSESKPATAHYSSIIPIDWNNQRQYIQLTELAVIGVSAEDGSVIWRTEWLGRVAVIPSPIFDEGKVYVTSGYGIGSKLIRIGDDNTATDVWYNKVMQNHHGGVVQIGDYFYGSSAKSFVCQDKESGERVWSDRKIKKGALAYADGRFYHVQESDGDVLLIAADQNSKSIKGKFTLSPQTKRRKPDGKIWVHPVIADGKLYLRDQEIIYCYDIKTK